MIGAGKIRNIYIVRKSLFFFVVQIAIALVLIATLWML
jgi:hypothetical protein